MRRRLFLLAALLACRREGTSRDEIVVLVDAPVARLDPRFAYTGWEVRVSRLIAPGLVGAAELGLGPTPGLAESLTSEDDRTWIARLRQDARFPDGRPVDAEDVRHTFATVMDPLMGSPYRKVWEETLEKVEVLDARTVRLRLRRPYAALTTDLEGLGIVDRRGGSETGGAGPYRIVERGTDRVVLARNPHYRPQPRTERLVVRTIRDPNSRVLALMGGSADLIENGVTPLVLETLEHEPDLTVVYGASATVSYLGFNLEDPVLRDRRVRQAIAMAIDRRRLVAARLRGHAALAGGILDEGNPFFDPEARGWPYDPAAARRLLAEAGHPHLELTWRTSALPDRIGLVRVMARMLADVGITIEVRPFEFATLMDDVRKGNFQLFSLQLTDVVEPDVLRAVFHSARIPTAANGWAGLNRFRYRNAEVDGLLDQAVAVIDPQRRKPLYARAQRALAEDLPALPLWHEENVIVSRRALQGVRISKTGRLDGLLGAYKGQGK